MAFFLSKYFKFFQKISKKLLTNHGFRGIIYSWKGGEQKVIDIIAKVLGIVLTILQIIKTLTEHKRKK